ETARAEVSAGPSGPAPDCGADSPCAKHRARVHADSAPYLIGYYSGSAFTNLGAKALIDDWNGTAWSQVATPVTPGNTALLFGVSAGTATDGWAVGARRSPSRPSRAWFPPPPIPVDRSDMRYLAF